MFKKILSFTFVLSLYVLFSQAADTNQKGWDLLFANKRFEARNYFLEKTKDGNTDACIGLMYSYWAIGKNDSAFFAFQKFYGLSDNPYPYLYACWLAPYLYEGRGYMPDYKVAFLNKIIADPKANGTLKAMAHNKLGHYYETVNNFEKRNSEYNAIGSIDNWQVLGTFDNTSGSGFAKDWGAVSKNKIGDKFKNKVDADVSWYKPPYFRLDRWFMFDYYFNISNSVMYAQTFLQSPTEQEVYLRSGCSGSMKIWVNDEIVLSEPTERNCGMDVYINKVKLNKGYNRILVQIGESETDNANFLLRLTDEDGNSLKGFTSTADNKEYEKGEKNKGTTERIFAEAFFEKKIKEAPDKVINHLLLADAFMTNDKVFEARKVLKNAKRLKPTSTLVSVFMIEAYARDKNVTDLTKEQEQVKKEDPDAILSLQTNISEANDREDYDEAKKIIDRFTDVYGESEYTEEYMIGYLANKKQITELIEAGKKMFAKYPWRFDLMKLNYNIESNASKNNSKAFKILKDYNKKYRLESAEDMLLEYYFDNGRKEEGMAILKQRVKNFPYAIGYYSTLSKVYYQLQQYSLAKEYAQKALEFAPYIGTYYQSLGQVLEVMNNKDEATEAYQNAIKYTPTDYESRSMLRKLNEEKDLYENFKENDITALFKKSPAAKDYPEDNSVVLLNEVKRIIYNENASEQKEELLVKVFNQAGIDDWKHYTISYNSYSQRVVLEKAEVLKKDGSTIKAESDDATIVFTNLEAGDAIHVLYKTENYFSGRLAQHFWDNFQFQYSIPSLLSRYSILVPDSKPFKYKIVNGNVDESVKTIGKMKLYEWSLKDQPAIVRESYMPVSADMAPYLYLSTIPDWKFISNWYSDLSSIKAKEDFEVKETVDELFKSVPDNLTELDKAKIIYNYIEDNIGYSDISFMHGAIIPQKASRTLSTKLGDCKDLATLFVAMCKQVGVKANLLLVDTKDNGRKHLTLPSTDFNHCIALLNADGKQYIIELTNQKLGFASLPDLDMNANYLFIPRDEDKPADTLSIINSPNMVPNKIIRTSKVSFNGNELTITRSAIRYGENAASTRSSYDGIGKTEREKRIIENISSDFNSTLKLNYLSFGDLKKLQDTICMTYSFNVAKGVQEVAGLKILKMPWTDAITTTDFMSLAERKYDFLISNFLDNSVYKETLTIELPKGAIVPEKPKNVKLTSKWMDYTMNYETNTPGKIIATRTLTVKGDIVQPKDYTQFKEFCTKMVDSDTRQLGLK